MKLELTTYSVVGNRCLIQYFLENGVSATLYSDVIAEFGTNIITDSTLTREGEDQINF